MSDLQAHTGSQLPTHGPSHAITDHRRRRHALPLHTCSNTAPPKHSPAQSSHGPPFGSRGSPTAADPLGSFQCVSLAKSAQRAVPMSQMPTHHGACAHSARRSRSRDQAGERHRRGGARAAAWPAICAASGARGGAPKAAPVSTARARRGPERGRDWGDACGKATYRVAGPSRHHPRR